MLSLRVQRVRVSFADELPMHHSIECPFFSRCESLSHALGLLVVSSLNRLRLLAVSVILSAPANAYLPKIQNAWRLHDLAVEVGAAADDEVRVLKVQLPLSDWMLALG